MPKKYLLIVDNDDEVRQQLVNELTNLTQMIVVSASDGVQAYQKTKNQSFDVVITDFNLPKISGVQLVAALRETSNNVHTPIIFYTKEIEKAKTETRGIKGIEYMEKTTSYEDLSSKIKDLSLLDFRLKRFRLDVDFINPFIDSSMKTLNGLCGVSNIKAQKPYLLGEEELEIDISGTLEISSPYFKGTIGISFEDEAYKVIIGQMVKESVGDISLENQDGAAEIINIIFGQTKEVLRERGYNLDRAVPSVMRGRGHRVINNKSIPILLVPFHSDLGNFWMQICVKAI